jgi:hypothetical protein
MKFSLMKKNQNSYSAKNGKSAIFLARLMDCVNSL